QQAQKRGGECSEKQGGGARKRAISQPRGTPGQAKTDIEEEIHHHARQRCPTLPAGRNAGKAKMFCGECARPTERPPSRYLRYDLVPVARESATRVDEAARTHGSPKRGRRAGLFRFKR